MSYIHKQITEKEFLEILERSREKSHNLSDWEDKFLYNLQFTYRQSTLGIEEWMTEKQVEKLREIAKKLWKD